jgi:hypothetical protein
MRAARRLERDPLRRVERDLGLGASAIRGSPYLDLTLPQVPALFGVFDGHGGARVSHYASKHLLARVNQVCPKEPQTLNPKPQRALHRP